LLRGCTRGAEAANTAATTAATATPVIRRFDQSSSRQIDASLELFCFNRHFPLGPEFGEIIMTRYFDPCCDRFHELSRSITTSAFELALTLSELISSYLMHQLIKAFVFVSESPRVHEQLTLRALKTLNTTEI
jgi:hypothetical protein